MGPDDDVADTPLSDPTYGCPDHSVDTCPEEPGLDSIHNYMGCKCGIFPLSVYFVFFE